MDLQLAGRVVLVVGGTGLIGRAIVDRLRAEGAIAVSASRSGHGDLIMDARDEESIASGMSKLFDEYGRLDGVVVTAAPSAGALDSTRASDPEQVRDAFDAKVMSFLRVVNAVLPVMSESAYGRIVGISGQNAFVTGNLTGSIRNAALIIAAKNLADSVAGTGITVNTVSPGLISETPSAQIEFGRSGEATANNVADLVVFLLSPIAGAISGESIAVGHRVRGVMSM